MPTIVDLGKAVKAKYPQYADMDDAAVGRAVKSKFPGSYDDYAEAAISGGERTGPRLKGETHGDPIQSIAIAAMLGPLVLGDAGAILPLSLLRDAGGALRQGALAAKATPPAWNPYSALVSLPGVEALTESLGLPRGVGAATEAAATYAPKGAAFLRGATQYLRHPSYGPEFDPTPIQPLRPPLWEGKTEATPSTVPDFSPIAPTPNLRGQQTTMDLTPAARNPAWKSMPDSTPTDLPPVQPIAPTVSRRTPPAQVPPLPASPASPAIKPIDLPEQPQVTPSSAKFAKDLDMNAAFKDENIRAYLDSKNIDRENWFDPATTDAQRSQWVKEAWGANMKGTSPKTPYRYKPGTFSSGRTGGSLTPKPRLGGTVPPGSFDIPSMPQF